jgi:hypothetical protein
MQVFPVACDSNVSLSIGFAGCGEARLSENIPARHVKSRHAFQAVKKAFRAVFGIDKKNAASTFTKHKLRV